MESKRLKRSCKLIQHIMEKRNKPVFLPFVDQGEEDEQADARCWRGRRHERPLAVRVSLKQMSWKGQRHGMRLKKAASNSLLILRKFFCPVAREGHDQFRAVLSGRALR